MPIHLFLKYVRTAPGWTGPGKQRWLSEVLRELIALPSVLPGEHLHLEDIKDSSHVSPGLCAPSPSGS